MMRRQAASVAQLAGPWPSERGRKESRDPPVAFGSGTCVSAAEQARPVQTGPTSLDSPGNRCQPPPASRRKSRPAKRHGVCRRRARNTFQDVLLVLDPEQLAQMVLDRLATIIPYDAGSVLTTSGSGGELECQAYRHSAAVQDETNGRWLPGLLRQPSMASGGRCVCVFDGEYRGNGQEHIPNSLKSLLAWPLVFRGETLGMIALCSAGRDYYSDEQLHLLKVSAECVSAAVANSLAHQRSVEKALAEERSRLARGLHDSVAQSLYSISLYAEAVRLALNAGNISSTFEPLAEINRSAKEGIADIRMLLFDLAPPVLEREGLGSAFLARLKAVEERAGVDSQLIVAGDRRLYYPLERELYSTVLEVLNNFLKHPQSSRVLVQLGFDDECATVSVWHDVTSFESVTAAIGLKSVEQRVERLGGRFSICPTLDQGIVVTVEVPT